MKTFNIDLFCESIHFAIHPQCRPELLQSKSQIRGGIELGKNREKWNVWKISAAGAAYVFFNKKLMIIGMALFCNPNHDLHFVVIVWSSRLELLNKIVFR